MNKLTTDRAMILEGLREDRAMLLGTADLEKEQMNVDADAVQEAIAENARLA